MLRALACFMLALSMLAVQPGRAQEAGRKPEPESAQNPEPGRADGIQVPNPFGMQARVDRPNLPRQRVIHILTDDDYPPLHFAGPDGTPTGFSVELARAICEELEIACTIQPRRFDTLLQALSSNRGDVIAAAMPIDALLRERFAVTIPYHRTPARFVTLSGNTVEPSPATLEGRTVGVVASSAHEAYLAAFFPRAQRRTYLSLRFALAGMLRGETGLVFGDGLSLALWLGGAQSMKCCSFRGGPYLESAYFGEGVGFVMRQDDEALRRAFDHALQVLWDKGVYAELYLRFFPIGFY